MIEQDGIAWLHAREIAVEVGHGSAVVTTRLINRLVPRLKYKGVTYYRAIEVCEIFGIDYRCHTCFGPISSRAVNNKYCSKGCRKAAVDTLAELALVINTSDNGPISIDSRLTNRLTGFAEEYDLPLPLATRMLLYLALDGAKDGA